MGRIKTMVVKRSSRKLMENSPESFAEDFESNKKALGNTMPSKRMKNMIAGYLTRIKKNSHKLIEEKKEE